MSEWSVFGIEPTSDKRTIKRAYAKLIKTVDPEKDPARFQQIREAYDYLLNYGRYYVEDDDLEQNQQSQFDSGFGAGADSDSDSDSDSNVEALANKSQEFDFNPDVESTTPNQSEEKKTSSQAIAVNPAELKSEVYAEPPISDVSSIGTLQPAQPTGFSEKTSYQSTNEFIEKLEALFQSDIPVKKSQWIALIEDEEYQYFDVVEQLRVEVFGFLVTKLEQNLEKGNQPEKLKLKLLKQRLTQDFEWLVHYFAEHFDWKNTELILSEHFSSENMKLLGQFYLKNIPKQPVETTKKSSNTKSFLIWVIFLIVLVKTFSALENDSNKLASDRGQTKVPELLATNNPSIFCSQYQLINSDQRATECERRLLPADNKRRFILALYWINKFDTNRTTNQQQASSDDSLKKGFSLLESASSNDYIPAINLLAWMKIGKHYLHQDQQAVLALLTQAHSLGDKKSALALAVGHYIGLWGKTDPSAANEILQDLLHQDPELTANMKYVLAACNWLGIKKPKANQRLEDMQQQAKMIFLDHSQSADLELVNNVAWFFATANNDSFDKVLALNIARQLQQEYRNSENWQHIDTLAAAYAARENYQQAIEYIDTAIQLVEKQYPQQQLAKREEAIEALNQHRSLFLQQKRVSLEQDSSAMNSILGASFSELMRLELENLPD